MSNIIAEKQEEIDFFIVREKSCYSSLQLYFSYCLKIRESMHSDGPDSDNDTKNYVNRMGCILSEQSAYMGQ